MQHVVPRTAVAAVAAILAVPLALGAGACGRKGASLPPVDQLDTSLRPAALAAALKRLPGAHFVATSSFSISPVAGAAAGGGGAPPVGAPQAVTTTTELWIDKTGQFQLLERNDHDGGREVVRHGAELSVALRHGKMIRRPVQEPEPTRYLEEAVGGAWAAWETVRRWADVEAVKDTPGHFRIKRGDGPVAVPAGFGEATPLRRWRDSIEVQTLEGEVRLDPQSQALLALNLKAQFSAVREDRVQITGQLAVTGTLNRIGSTSTIVPPVDAEELRPRQRTILEERALLGGLNTRARPAKESR